MGILTLSALLNTFKIPVNGYIYFYGPIAIIGTVLIGYLGSLFGPELPYDNIRGVTVAKKHKMDDAK